MFKHNPDENDMVYDPQWNIAPMEKAISPQLKMYGFMKAFFFKVLIIMAKD